MVTPLQFPRITHPRAKSKSYRKSVEQTMSLRPTTVTTSVTTLAVRYSWNGGHGSCCMAGKAVHAGGGRMQSGDFTTIAGALDLLILCWHGLDSQNEWSSVSSCALSCLTMSSRKLQTSDD